MSHRYRVKICGITNLEDALAAERLGADYVGVVVEVPYTRRSLTAQQAQPIFREVRIPRVALLMEPTRERFGELIEVLQPDAVQLLGRETVEDVVELKASQVPLWKSLHLPPAEAAEAVDLEGLRAAMHVYARAGAAMFVLDTKNTVSGVTHYGGTGLASDWNLARELVKDAPLPVMLAGGLGPENVAQALQEVEPYGADLSSGVEARVGKKDEDKMRRLIEEVRAVEGRRSRQEMRNER